MSTFTVTLPSGLEWVPQFVTDVDHEACIGCGRCFKACLHGVLSLRGLDEDGELVDEDDEDAEYERKVIVVAAPEGCVGCQACSTVCSRKCIGHAPASV